MAQFTNQLKLACNQRGDILLIKLHNI